MSAYILAGRVRAHQLYRLRRIKLAQPEVSRRSARPTTAKLKKDEMFSVRQECRPACRPQTGIRIIRADRRRCTSARRGYAQ